MNNDASDNGKNENVQQEATPQSGKLRVGKTLYHINVYFGKTPLEEILKDKFINKLKTEQERF